MKGSGRRIRYVWVPVVLALLAVALGFAYVHWSRSGPGSGLYSRLWAPEPVQGYWDPDAFYRSVEGVQGHFENTQCIACHGGITPGIVTDWQGGPAHNGGRVLAAANADIHAAALDILKSQ